MFWGFLLVPILLALPGCSQAMVSIAWYQPEQVHLSYGETPWDITVTWSTFNETAESVVEYGINGMILKETGTTTKFIDDGFEMHTQYIHRVYLRNLTPHSLYVYHCGSKLGWSDRFTFWTAPSGNDGNWQPHLAIFGDLGNENAQSLARLQEETQRNMYDAILHDNGRVGDEFMRQIQPIAALLPYMTCPGNHEEKYNFSNYKARFSMPGPYESLMYTFTVGPMRIISISTEFYYFLNYGVKPLLNQYRWLENELKRASLPQNRAKYPWLVLMGHRPMYCSNADHDDCTFWSTKTRIGLPVIEMFGLEQLAFNAGVDLMLWAHEHSYERLWPIYNYTVLNGSVTEPYRNPKGPVHIVTGSAGCKERTDPFRKERPPWSAFASNDYGYTRMKVYNSSHLYLEQVSDDLDGAVIDSVWIIKDHHGPYPNSTMNWAKIEQLGFYFSRLRSPQK